MLLDIQDLHLEFRTFDGVSKVLAGVNLTMQRGDVLGLVGETGCGKSMTALAILGLIPMPPGHITAGRVHFDGDDMLSKTREQMQQFRAKRIGMIFQDPTTNLSPVYTIREQLIDAVLYQRHVDGGVPGRWRGWQASVRQMRLDAERRALELMALVGIPDGERRIAEYPHQFSGGMRQRVLIAMALAGNPDLLIADEPTTALDVTIQAQILRLIVGLVKQLGLSVLIITHNLGVVAQTCQNVAVMYAGRVIETAPVRALFKHPQHPYTQGLLKAVPTTHTRRGELEGIPGTIPNLARPPSGCRFHPRCAHVMDICTRVVPVGTRVSAGHTVECHLYENLTPQSPLRHGEGESNAMTGGEL
ncbi:MAG: ABC transporter ATP-binding protein [Chloroflexota bacterium]|nr:ABC transporter ATP-binding protein [Chloroflexota bacterium]